MEFTPINNRKDSSFYQEEMEIRFCQCDASHRLKVSELFRIMTTSQTWRLSSAGWITSF